MYVTTRKEVEVVSVTRLRTKNEKGPNPMRVRFRTEETKWKVLRNAKKLANAGENLKNIFIKKDMTLLEREQDYKLRQELKEKKLEATQQNNGKVWIIRRGKVIDVSRKSNQKPEQEKDNPPSQKMTVTAQIH